MADYFIDPVDGSDLGDGSVGDPWKTWDHAVGSGKAVGAVLAEPTNVHQAGGTAAYEQFEIQVTPSAQAPLTLRGDFDGSAQRAAGSANPKTGAAGILSSSEFDSWSGTTIKADGKSHITFERLSIQGEWAIHLDGSTNCVIRDSHLSAPPTHSNSRVVRVDALSGVAANILVERCWFMCGRISSTNIALRIYAPRAAADYDVKLTVRSCFFFAGTEGVYVSAPGSGAGRGVGLVVQNCGFFGSERGAVGVADAAAVSGPVLTLRASWVAGANTGLSGGSSGLIDEDGCIIAARTPRHNTSAGANSMVGDFTINAPVAAGSFGPDFRPAPWSPIVGWGSYGTTPDLDLYGRPFDPVSPACGPIEYVEPSDPGPPGPSMPRCFAF